jgi:F-type H+-transporting ATPase subunit a
MHRAFAPGFCTTERIAAMRKHLPALFAVVLAVFLVPSPTQAAEGDDTLDIVGHAADGYYLAFEPFAKAELPRIFLLENAEGNLTVDVYGTTTGALQSGNYNLVTEGDDGASKTLTSQAEINEAIEGGKHLYGSIAPKAGSIVLDFSVTRHLVYGLLAMLVTALIFITLANRYKRGIGRDEAPRGVFHNMFEAMIVFIRDEIAKPTMGEKYERFLPYLLTAFFFILFANLFGLVPYGAAATSNLAITGMLALFTFVIGQVYGSKEHFKHLFMGPEGVPWWVRPILVPVEILGLFTRHLALAIRLFANMLAGALVIFSLLGLIFIVNVVFGPSVAYGASIPSIGLTVFILLVKLLVAFIQAYVFTMLSALFIGMAVEEHHDEESTPETQERDTGALTPEFGGDGTAVEQRSRPETPEPVAS